MRTVLLVAGNDLRRRLRDRSALVTALIAPLVLATIVGVAFGGTGGGNSSGAVVRVAVADHGDSPATAALVDAVARWAQPGPGIAVVRSPSVRQALADKQGGRVTAVVEVPRGFMTAPQVPFPNVIVDRDSPIGQSVAFALAQGMVEAAATARSAAGSATITPAALQAIGARPPIAVVDAGGGTRRSLIGYFGPAVAMVFLFFGIGMGARSVLAERQEGTLARLQVAPVPFGHVLAGKLLGMVSLSMVSVLVVWATTTWLLGATWGDPAGVLVLTVAVVAAMGALALFVTVIARNEAQADAATAGIGFALALLGGNFFPPGSLPPFFEKLALLTPNGWGLQGYGLLAIDGKGLSAVWGPVLALVVLTAAFGVIAVLRFRRAVAT
jgi:ABC-2 type transport system permease protein